jgi:hypothetical protein
MAVLATEHQTAGPHISVVATTIQGTEAALLAAKAAAQGRGGQISLLVPRVDFPAPPPDRFVDTTSWLVARYEKIARDVGQPVRVRVCACRSAAEAAARLGPASGTLFVGGPERWWWPTAEKRLAATLRRAGRDVIYVACNRG